MNQYEQFAVAEMKKQTELLKKILDELKDLNAKR